MSSLEPEPMVAVTGATGYIGGAVIQNLIKNNISVVALSRNQVIKNIEYRSYDLRLPVDQKTLLGVGAVIHLAAETFRGASADICCEVNAVKNLITACRTVNARLVYVSSQTAQEFAPTKYGRSKWLCEQEVLAAGGIVIRPGQVYGGEEAGLYGSLCRFLKNSVLIPSFVPQPQVQPVHVDDLAHALVICVRDGVPGTGIYKIAASKPIEFTRFLKLIAFLHLRRPALEVVLPLKLLIKISNIPFFPAAIRNSGLRLESLLHLPVMNTEGSVVQLGIKLRSLTKGLNYSKNGRRGILVEANIIIGYLIGRTVPKTCIKRYVRSVEAMYDGSWLEISHTFHLYPSLMAFIDLPIFKRCLPEALFWKRLDLATVCVETSVDLVDFFFVSKKSNRLIDVAKLFFRIGGQVICIVCSIVFYRYLISFVPNSESSEYDL